MRHRVSMLLISAAVAFASDVAAESRIVAQGRTGAEGDGKADVVTIVLVSGHVAKEGCAEGDVLVGRFAVKVRKPSGRTVKTNLNDLVGSPELRFVPGPAGMIFFDFTHDGRPCFAVAEMSCGNNGFYRFFALAQNGTVSLLCFAPPPNGRHIFGNNTIANDESLRVTKDGFECDTYNNADGESHTAVFRWMPEQGIFMEVEEKVSK